MNKDVNEAKLKDNLFRSYKSIDRLLCISDCSRFDYCNLVSFNQANNVCKHYFLDSFDQNGLIDDSKGVNLYYLPSNNTLKQRIDRIYQEYSLLTSNSSNINKTTLTFYEFNKLQRQNAKSITIQGDETQMAMITSRRIYFSDGNWYSKFYMPHLSSFGQILFLEVNSATAITVKKARTNLVNDISVDPGHLAMFVNDLVKWNFIASVNQTVFLASFK